MYRLTGISNQKLIMYQIIQNGMYNSSDASDLPKEKEMNFENNLVEIN
jgi:hypothetical protein